jgi:NAD(P)H-hydrate epimerase
VRVLCLASAEELKGDARIAALSLTALGAPIEAFPAPEELLGLVAGADLVVDALLGTGADRPVQGRLREIIETLNALTTPVISMDVPSGLDAETGSILGVCVRASHTVTFAHLKRGLLTTAGHENGGTITVSHIGVPAALSETEGPSAWLLEEEDLPPMLPKRSPTSHKGMAGRVVVVAGSPGMTGAARLVGHACLRAGAGLVTLSGERETVGKLDSEVVELMTHTWGERDTDLLERADALVVGPGLGRSESAGASIERSLSSGAPTVLDADALRYLAAKGSEILRRQREPWRFVLTPHAGEAAALLGCTIEEIEADRFGAAQRLADDFQSAVVLKGSRSVIASPGEVPVVCAMGSAALGTAGSGDTLSGILGAFLVGASSSVDVFHRAQLAVGVHALAGQHWSEKSGDRGLLASEIADAIPEILNKLQPFSK